MHYVQFSNNKAKQVVLRNPRKKKSLVVPLVKIAMVVSGRMAQVVSKQMERYGEMPPLHCAQGQTYM